MAHYAIWDDHDFGPNNSDRSFWNKELSRDVFSYFWANPSYGLPQNGGITSMFTWNDVEVFLLDNRYFRSVNERKSGGRTILGAVQLEWLKDALASSTAPFKFVAMGGQLLSDARKYEMYSNYGFDAERAEIIKFIQEEGIKGVIFINGDRHHTELSVLKEENKPTIYDLTVSPLTSGSHFSTEVNNLRVPETYVAEQNYAEIFVKGAFKKRYVEVVVRDKTGKKLWEKRLDP
jgi:alkaline phosphatase D